MQEQKIAFVGGGNMTQAIVGGLLADGYPASNISIAEPSTAQRELLANQMPGVFVSADNDEVAIRATCVVLSVKPQIIASVCRQLSETVQSTRPLIISIAAGPRIADIDAWLGGGISIARVMPNQPALLQMGVSGLYANEATSPDQLAAARGIMSAVGPVVTVASEKDMDVVTAVSGSGPAYFYLLIDILANTAEQLGLDKNSARQLAVETAAGAATLAKASDDTMGDLIARVRSPGGTTSAALDSLEKNGVRDIFNAAVVAARDRATELADQAHQDNQD
jgi:pyrroline-5-carboxylate reductase